MNQARSGCSCKQVELTERFNFAVNSFLMYRSAKQARVGGDNLSCAHLIALNSSS